MPTLYDTNDTSESEACEESSIKTLITTKLPVFTPSQPRKESLAQNLPLLRTLSS